MGIMTLDALLAMNRPALLVPVSIGAAVHSVSPITVDWTVALRTEFLWLIEGHGITPVIREGVPGCPVMAIEAALVNAVPQGDVPVLRERPIRLFRRWKQLVAFGATVSVSGEKNLRPQDRVSNRRRIHNPRGNPLGDRTVCFVRPGIQQEEDRKRGEYGRDGPPTARAPVLRLM
jgi:hypothetical protein